MRMERPGVLSSGIGMLIWAPHHFSQVPLMLMRKAAISTVSLPAVGSAGCLRVPQNPAHSLAQSRHLVNVEEWRDEWMNWVSVILHRSLRERLMLVIPKYKARVSCQTKARTAEETLRI